MASLGMRSVKAALPRGTRAMPGRAPEYRTVDAAAYDALAAARPRRPPPFAFAPRRLTAGQLEAHRYNASAGRLNVAPHDDDAEAEPGGTHQIVELR